LRSFEAMRFWGAGLTKLNRKGAIVWTTLTMKDRKEAGYSGKDDADLINVLSSINDSKVSIIFVEQPNGNVKISWRAVSGLDVASIAMQFGGGGHAAAAGAEITGEMNSIVEKVLEITYQQLFDARKNLQTS
ncbi:MAG: DHH family phosphoesterase, partial [Anaerolineales bacterium]